MPKPLRQPTFATVLIVSSLAFLAMAVSGYLSWLAIGEGESALGCGGGTFDCDEVLGSRWSVWLGTPVSILGMLAYTVILLSTLTTFFSQTAPLRHAAWTALMMASTAALGAACWFTALQAFSVQAFCPYCCTVHACGFVIAVLLVLKTIGPLDTSTEYLAPSSRLGIALGACSLILLIGGQLLAPPKSYEIQHFADAAAEADEKNVTANDGGESKEPQATGDSKRSVPSPSNSGSATADDRERLSEETRGEPAAIQRDERTIGPTEDAQSRESLARQAAINKEWLELFETPSRSSKPVAKTPSNPTGRQLRLIGGRLTLSLGEHMLLGSIDAPHIIVELFDYTCSHCRRMHRHVKKAQERYGEQLAIVLLTVPMHSGCNPSIRSNPLRHQHACEFARLADVVWQNRRDAFPQFHDWLFEGARPPTAIEVRRHVKELLGEEAYAATQTDDSYRQRLLRCIYAYDQCQKGRIPKLIIRDKVSSGEILYAEDLYDLMEDNLSIEPAAR